MGQKAWLLFFSSSLITYHALACEDSVVLTQTHPAGNITVRCQYDSVENVLGVLWVLGNETTANPSTIPGHTALPRTTTYQAVVVDSYTNLRERYECAPALSNRTVLDSNVYVPQIDVSTIRVVAPSLVMHKNLIDFCCAHRSTCLYVGGKSSNVLLYNIVIIVCCGEGVNVLRTGY